VRLRCVLDDRAHAPHRGSIADAIMHFICAPLIGKAAFSLLRNTARRFDFVTIWNNDPALRLEPGSDSSRPIFILIQLSRRSPCTLPSASRLPL